MSSLKIRQADGTFRDILMIKGDKGDTGVATEAINDALIDTEHTWSSSKINSAIPTSLPANGGNADTVGGKRVADFMQRFIKTGKIETFDTIIDSGIYRINEFDESLSIPTGMEQYGQLLVLNGENSDTVTQIYSNYSNNTMFFRSCSNWGKLESDWTSWDKLVNSTYVANNLTTNQEGYVLDARQGKSLKDSIDTINNNLQLIDFTGTTLDYSHVNGMSMLELPSIPNKNIVAIYPCIRTDGLTYNGLFVNDWGSCFALLTDGTNKSINSTEVSIKILAL